MYRYNNWQEAIAYRNCKTKKSSVDESMIRKVHEIVENVLSLVAETDIKLIQLLINEKRSAIMETPVVSVNVVAETNKYINYYFKAHTYEEVYNLLITIFKFKEIPYEQAGTHDGIVIVVE